jgi:hypothetical protein
VLSQTFIIGIEDSIFNVNTPGRRYDNENACSQATHAHSKACKQTPVCCCCLVQQDVQGYSASAISSQAIPLLAKAALNPQCSATSIRLLCLHTEVNYMLVLLHVIALSDSMHSTTPYRWPKTIFLKALGPFLACTIGIVVVAAGKWGNGELLLLLLLRRLGWAVAGCVLEGLCCV